MIWRHTGDCANIAFYRGPDGYWCESMRNAVIKRGGKLVVKQPFFRITLYEQGVGEVGSNRYRPNVKVQRLSGEQIAARVRIIIKENEC